MMSPSRALVAGLALALTSPACTAVIARQRIIRVSDEAAADLQINTRASTLPELSTSGKTLPDVASVVAAVGPAVVSIAATKAADETSRSPRSLPSRHIERAMGSGFIISPDGLVVTNAHVIEGATRVRVTLADERELDAVVMGQDDKLDVALLRITGAKNLPTATMGSSKDVRVGDPVVAIGNPFGLEQTVTLGIVSAKGRVLGLGPYDQLIQTDASINPGSSGGPLFDPYGRVIGINTVMHARGQGIGFAIPIDDVRAVLPALREDGRVDRGVLGLAFQEITYDLAQALSLRGPEGALVTEVETTGPAARAGLEPGDVILSVDGQSIEHASALARFIGRRKPGEIVRLEVFRQGASRNVRVRLAADEQTKEEHAPTDLPSRNQGIGAVVSNAQGGGAKVEALDPRGPAVGELQVGDVVTEVNGRPIKRGDDFVREVGHAKRPGVLLVRLLRDGDPLYVALRLE